jgi:predicted amidophosphoribosyltransferase
MALTKCPECKGDVSFWATTCPKCGYPLSRGGSGTGNNIEKLGKALTGFLRLFIKKK